MSIKVTKLCELFSRLTNSGFIAMPEYMVGKDQINISGDSDLNERNITISMDDANTVKVVTEYHSYEYTNTLDDRRNAIKTAKDIFDFLTDLKCRNLDKISPGLKDKRVPNVALYYCNNYSNDRVVVTSTRRYEYSDFLINYNELLLSHSRELDYLTQLIAEDNQGIGKQLRWELPVYVDKHWWRH